MTPWLRTSVIIPVADSSQPGEARRAAIRLGFRAGLDEATSGRLALVVAEAATNVYRHGAGGEIILRVITDATRSGVELLAIDRGPGMRTAAGAKRSGRASSAPLPEGAGLGTIARLADEVEILSGEAIGTVLLARVWSAPRVGPVPWLDVGAVSAPRVGEDACGDGWECAIDDDVATIVVSDGVGHGVEAARATARALDVFRDLGRSEPAEQLHAMHAQLRRTRGAAVAIARVLFEPHEVHFAGVGNVSASIVSGGSARPIASHEGTVGQEVGRLHETIEALSPGDALVIHTDGVGTHWAPSTYAAAAGHDSTILAGLVFRDARGTQDDATVVVARRREPPQRDERDD